MTDEKKDVTPGAAQDAKLDKSAERGFKNQPVAPIVHTFTVILDDGKRLQSKSEDTEAKLQSAAQAAGKDGYSFEENGVWTHYPARRIAKVTVQVAE